MVNDNRERFSGRADKYSVGRPSYASDFIRDLSEKYGFSENTVVADIGSGTGKLTKQILELGCMVFGVEPNDDMRQIAECELSCFLAFMSVDGDASDTGLPDESVDYITVAQAFHWFPVEEFRNECLRIGRTGCRIFLIWNQMDRESAPVRELYNLYSLFGNDFKGFNSGLKHDDDRIKTFFRNNYTLAVYENPLSYTKEAFRNRCTSSSNAPLPGDEALDIYIAEVDRIFETYAIKGSLIIPNNTTVYTGIL